MQVQKLRNQKVQTITEPMFSRYLFIQLDDQTQNWGPIRSTLGVSKLVSFGPQPAKVPPELVAFLQEAPPETLERMFAPMADASINALAEAILKVIETEPLYYSAVAERFADHTFQAVARALGKLHTDEKLWQDPRGRLCVRGSAHAAKVPGRN